MTRAPTRRGMALLFVLGAVALLSSVAVSLHTSTMGAWRLARREADRARALGAARSGLALAEELLKADNRPYFWFPAGEVPLDAAGRELALSELEEAYLRLSRTPEEPLDMDGVGLEVELLDEGAFLNLNRAPAANFERLLLALGVTPPETEGRDAPVPLEYIKELVAAWEDWRDPDDATRPFGAERTVYEQAEPFPYRPRNGPLLVAEELGFLRGYDEAVLYGGGTAPAESGDPAPDLADPRAALLAALEGDAPPLIELVTVHGLVSRVNANTAAPKLLEATPGVFESAARRELVATILANRPHKSRVELRGHLAAIDADAAAKAIVWLDVRSEYFRVRTRGRVAGSANLALEVVLRRLPGGRVQRVFYRER